MFFEFLTAFSCPLKTPDSFIWCTIWEHNLVLVSETAQKYKKQKKKNLFTYPLTVTVRFVFNGTLLWKVSSL